MSTYTATSWSGVQAACDSATVEGDIVFLDFTSSSATSQVIWTAPANAILMGRGSSATGGDDLTIIIDDFNSASPMLSITVSATGSFRITGITFRTNDNDPVKENGEIGIGGPGGGVSVSVRLDHLHFDNHTNSGAANANAVKLMFLYAGVFGVMDHCIVDAYAVSAIYIGNGAGSDGRGDATWANATSFGASNFFFFEDNIFRATTASPIRTGDTFSAGRMVLRFNNMIGGAGQEEHATGASGEGRGARAVETYGNSFEVLIGQAFPPRCISYCSAGTSLVWGNFVESEALQNMFMFDVIRSDNTSYTQIATPNGWGYAGTEFNGTGSNWDGGTYLTTDTLKGYPCIDQPGRGIGDLLTGNFPTKVNSTTGTIAWPNQALEPLYFWRNTGLVPNAGYGGGVYVDMSDGRVIAGRDYYPQASSIQTSPTSPFDGTVGVGWGTLANRPTTCIAGVAYFAIDEGDWNQSVSNPYGVQQNGANGVLYKATATNTWTLYYEPYTYPHPLRAETSSSSPIIKILNTGKFKNIKKIRI